MRKEISLLAGLTALAAALAVAATAQSAGGGAGHDGNGADLAIVKSDGRNVIETGANTTYNISVTNVGAVAVEGALVNDTPPDDMTCGDWICIGENGGSCGADVGSGQIADLVDLPVGGSVHYQLSCRMDDVSSASTVTNTALVHMPVGVEDVNLSNNVSTDSNALLRVADLSVTLSNGVDTLAPGASTTYTIVVDNAGPNAATSVVNENFPTSLQNCSWTCSASNGVCAPSGTGDFIDSGAIQAGGRLTYTATCTVAAGASGSISNVASVAVGKGERDYEQANNNAIDTDTVGTAGADIAVTVDDGRDYVRVGDTLDYVIRVNNTGGSSATVDVSSVLPDALSSGSWTCVPRGGASCTQGSGNTLSDTAGMPAGSEVSYLYSATVQPAASTDLIDSTVDISASGDSNPANDRASDNNMIVIFRDGVDAPAAATVTATAPKAGTAQGYNGGRLQIDPQLLAGLGLRPVTIASGVASGGMELFRLQLARVGDEVMLRVVLHDAAGLEQRGNWLAVDPRVGIDYAWQAAGSDAEDGYLRVGSGSVVQTSAGRTEPLPLAGLRIYSQQGLPWVVISD